MNEEIKIHNKTNIENNKKISHFIPLDSKKYNDNSFIQKSKEHMKNKKSISMKHIFDKKDKISIKINQNININANIKNIEENYSSNNQKPKDIKIYKTNKDKGSKNQTEDSCDNYKLKRTKSCNFNYNANKDKEKKCYQ